ncbi:MAG TPA: hypothetical protein VH643_25230 [Gemmataceae bacterium]|jgi:hypothetical protein
MDGDFPAAHSMDTRWYAIDEAGHLGVFSSGENGHVPELAVIDDLALELWRVRHPDRADSEGSLWGLEGEEIADELGAFIFYYGLEFDPIGTYGVTGTPKTPLHVDQLPPELRQRWKEIRFRTVDFSQIMALQPLEYGPCVYWYEEDRVAYLCSDDKTVRPIPGMEHRFAEFCKQFREENPEEAKQFIFEEPQEKLKKPRRRRRKENEDGK